MSVCQWLHLSFFMLVDLLVSNINNAIRAATANVSANCFPVSADIRYK